MTEQIRQGSELEKGKSFIAIVCDKEDIEQQMKSDGFEITNENIDKVYEYAKRKLTDYMIEDFWNSLTAINHEVLKK